MIDAMIAEFSGKTSLLVVDLESGAERFFVNGAVRVSAASTIKVPILLTVLHMGCNLDAEITLHEILHDTMVFDRGIFTYTLRELLFWMIAKSDNTATNAIIDMIGFDAVNDYMARLGLTATRLQRKMLDVAAKEEGRDNFTSAYDQYLLYKALYRGEILDAPSRRTALDILRRQRASDSMLRYIADPVVVAHKTGGLDFIAHDAGVFETKHPFYLGIFTWDGPSREGDAAQKKYIGTLAKIIFDAMKIG